MGKINVLHIIEGLSRYGGTPNKLLLISKYLDHDKFNISIAVFSDDNTLSEDFEKLGINIYRVSANFFLAIYQLCSLILEKKADIVSTHFVRANMVGTISAIICKKILVQNEHGLPRGYKTKRGLIARLIVYLFDKLTYNFKDAYIINSYTVRKELQSTIRKSSKKYFVVQNAIDIYRYSTTLNNQRSHKNEIIFGSIGGFIIQGIRDFTTPIKAVKLLVDEGINVQLLIGGDGPDKPRIESMIKDLGLSEHVKILGYIKNLDFFYSHFDVFVYPITQTAGIGLSLLESMYFRKPVISFAEGEIEEQIIQDGIHGFKISPFEVTSLANTMRIFIDNPGICEIMGERCNQEVVNFYNGERISMDVENIYKSLISSKLK